LGGLLQQKGGIAAVERQLEVLEALTKTPQALRLLRAQLLLRNIIEVPPDKRHELADRAIAHSHRCEPMAANRTHDGPQRRRTYLGGAMVQARDAYHRYLDDYQHADWSWVAAIRLGQAAQALGSTGRAAGVFRRAASNRAFPAVGRALAHAYASDALLELGRADEALKEADGALSSWDDDFGVSYHMPADHGTACRSRTVRDRCQQRHHEERGAGTRDSARTRTH